VRSDFRTAICIKTKTGYLAFLEPGWSFPAASAFWQARRWRMNDVDPHRLAAILSKGTDMTISTLALTPLISLIAGVLILVMPRLLNYIVALYLIVVGLLGLFPQLAG
jgi:hypothetical protein